MRIRSLTQVGALGLSALLVTAAAVSGQAPTTAATHWMPAHTSDGQPDLQGKWNSIDSFFTPLQRPTRVAGKEKISKEELQAVLGLVGCSGFYLLQCLHHEILGQAAAFLRETRGGQRCRGDQQQGRDSKISVGWTDVRWANPGGTHTKLRISG